jgi:hypothetical protein
MKKNILFFPLFLLSINCFSQNVGIGTLTPSHKLHVVGSARITSLGGAGDALVLSDNNGVLSNTSLSGNGTDVLDGTGTFVPISSLTDAWLLTGNAGTSPGGNYLGTSDAQDLQVRTNGTLRYTVESTGEIRMANSANTYLRSGANGGARILGQQGNTAAKPAIGFFSTNGVDDGAGGNGIYRPLANVMAFATSSAERMRITPGGTIGIGTTAPAYNVETGAGYSISVNDGYLRKVRALYLQDWDDNTGGSNDKYRLLARDGAWQFYNGGVVVGNYGNSTWTDLNDGYLIVEGRIGVATTAPSRQLDVNGFVRFRGGGPSLGEYLMAQNTNGDATWSTSGYGMVPIGTIVAWHKNATGVPALPAGWIECNGGTSNGIAVPNLNGATTSKSADASLGRFLRGNTTSGAFQTDQSNNLRWINHDDSGNGDTNDFFDDDGTTLTIRNYSTSGDRLQAYLEGVETRVSNMTVVWIMRTR